MKTVGQILILLLASVLVFGCSTKMGAFGEKTHFAFPNSNVTPLGHVKVEKSKFSIIIPRTIDADDIKELLDEALAQQAGADLIINYQTDVKYTMIPIPIIGPYFVTYTLEGTAASMEVGNQALLENTKY